MTAIQSSTTPVTYKEIARFPGYRFGDDGSVWSSRMPGRGARFRSQDNDKWRRIGLTRRRTGYLSIRISADTIVRHYMVHRLILEAFVGPCPEGKECCHYDGNPANNQLENLRWDTRIGNMADRIRHGTGYYPSGAENSRAKLTDEDIPTLRRLFAEGWTQARLAAAYGVHKTTIGRAVLGKTKFTPDTRRNRTLTQPTPGPWSYETMGEDDPRFMVGPDPKGMNFVAVTSQGNDEANARLIAAAPELLAVCRSVLAYFAGTVVDDIPLPLGAERQAQLRRAVEKAIG